MANDGKILINTDMDDWFEGTCKILKCPQLFKDPRFSDPSKRNAPSYDEDGKLTMKAGENFPALHAEIQSIVASHSRNDLEKNLSKADVPAMKM